MSIVKLKAVTISGQLNDFDRVADKYIYGRDIHLESAISVMHDKNGLMEFNEPNEYDGVVKEIGAVLELAGIKDTGSELADNSVTADEMREYAKRVAQSVADEKRRGDELRAELEKNNETLEVIEPIIDVNADLSRLMSMEFITCSYGHLPKTGYKTLTTYLDDSESFFLEASRTETDVWGFYFAPRRRKKKIDDMFRNLYFESVEIPVMRDGTPRQIRDGLLSENRSLTERIRENDEEIKRLVSDSGAQLFKIYNLAVKRGKLAEIKKNAMHSDMMFFVVGWMEAKAAAKLEREITKAEKTVVFYQEDPKSSWSKTPPTRLKNNFVFKPFEMFVKMYGMPRYGEIDPTPILAVTYILFFGIMFGDVGQSLILAIAGFIIYKVKKMDLAGIVGFVGISGVVFGFIYGSVFGNEEIIPALFHTMSLKPMEQIGLMLGGTIGIGVAVIIFGMVLNVLNLIKAGKKGECICSHNGIAGIVFYLAVLCLAGNMLLKLGLPSPVFAAAVILSLLAMFFEEPLSKLIDGKKNWMPKGGMFFVESFFELFEVILSFFSNTISFLRIGAFAIVHVGMMTVVAVLSEGGGAGGIAVQIIGNALVMCLEGLIVGIQVLRLEYYEMFSRYFSGGGRPFVSLKDK